MTKKAGTLKRFGMKLRSAKLKVGSKVKRARDSRAKRLLAACKRFKFVK